MKRTSLTLASLTLGAGKTDRFRFGFCSFLGRKFLLGSQIFFLHCDNLIKHRMVVSTMLSSCVYHIMLFFYPLEGVLGKIYK